MSERRRSARLKGQAPEAESDLDSSVGSLKSANGSTSPAKRSKSGPATSYDPAPKTEHYEFMGPAGAVGVTVSVIYFAYFFAIGCNEGGCPPWPVDRFMVDGARRMGTKEWWISLWDSQAMVVYLTWYAWTVVCWAVLPGRMREGAVMRNGQRLLYKENAFKTLIVTLAGLAAFVAANGVKPLLFVHQHWTGLVTAMLVMSVVQSLGVYAMSFGKDIMLAEGGNSPSQLYNWFIGRGLNPRIGSFDIKSFNELRPGLILWLLTDLAMAGKQYHDLGRITDSMVLVVLFQGVYVFDALWNEPAILTTMDITTDGFGFMLAAGDLLWARYLAVFPIDLGVFGIALILAINGLGYYIFRSSNGEKDAFRSGRNPKNLQSMETKRGTRLLTSGWWGMSRHPNYLGDLLMALVIGGSPLTLFYVAYFTVLLVHRQMRDDEACKKKYGADWDRYCKLVPSRIVPGVY